MIRILLVAVVVSSVSCTGPSKTGQEARKKAHDRMDLVNADLASQQARQEFEVGQLDAAVKTIDAAIARFAHKSQYHQLRGRILLEQHRLDDARLAFETAARLNPDNAETYYLLGVLHQRWSDDEAALRSYTTACENDPSHAQFFIARAETLAALDRPDEAIALLKGGHQFQHQAAVPALLGQIYLRTGNPEIASRYLSDSRSLGNDNPILFADLAVAEFNSGLYAECLMTLRELELNPKQPLSPLQRRIKGKCLAATGRLVQGRDICLSITRETPQDADAWVDLGFIAWKMGDYRRLYTCGEEISRLAPARWEGPLFVGKGALESENVDLAVTSFELAQSLTEDDELEKWITAAVDQASTKTATVLEEAPNMVTDTAEGAFKELIRSLAEGSLPMVTVPQDAPLQP